ncbi:hypothetical protein BDV06DRAFT_11933 [Aspergillus oleicola]
MLPNSAIGLFSISRGLGKDIWLIPFQEITTLILLFFVGETLYVISIAFTKICMLLLLLRLFPDDSFRLVTKLVLALTMVWCLAFLFALLFTCRPLSYFWRMWEGEGGGGACFDQVALVWAHGITNMVLDVVILVLPMPTLIKLNLSWGRKIGICSMFAVGILVTAVSIIRLIAVHNFNIIDNPTRKSIVNLATWSLIEVPLSITCVCIPGIRAFFYYTYKRLCKKGSACDDSPSSGRPSNVPSLVVVQPDTFRSANREQGDFIRFQEIGTVRPK